MIRKFVVNEPQRGASFFNDLRRLLEGSSRVDMAVSYLQLSGWDLLEPLIADIEPKRVRLLLTDQFAFTHPEALRKTLASGIQIRNYVGARIYHPKVYISYDAAWKPKAAIVGSANISDSGLVRGVEAGVALSDLNVLRKLKLWFQGLFGDTYETRRINTRDIKALERLWAVTVAKRIETRRQKRKESKVLPANGRLIAEDLDVIEDLLSGVRQPIGILNIDQAGNNIRNLSRLLTVLKRYPSISGKERSELHLLGLMEDSVLTSVGKQAQTCRTEKTLATVWCHWVRRETEERLLKVNPKIVSFRRAASQFWRFRTEVRRFFLRNLQSYHHRNILQTIELFCNARDAARGLTVDDFRSFAPVLLKTSQLPKFIQRPVLDYLTNKGSRSWGNDDRKTMLLAWRAVSGR